MQTTRDDEEDDAPRLRPVEPGGKRPSPVPGGDPKSLAWGTCAVFHQVGDLTEFPGERGVIRYVTSGVRFVQPPTGWEWRAALTEPGRYEMKWLSEPAAVRTLAVLRAELDFAARNKQLESSNHPLLKELDNAAMALARLAGKLHQVGWSVGLLRPDNVILLGHEAVPIDLGFTWKGTFGSPPWDDSPGRPAWLEQEVAFAWLYDHPPVRQQFADPGNGTYPPAAALDDVRTIGRLLAWLVSGQENRNLPLVRNAPPAWTVIADAAGGDVANADELTARLRTIPPSGYFARLEKPLPLKLPTENKSKVPLIVALIALVGLGAAATWYFTKDKSVNPGEGTAGGNGGESHPGNGGDPASNSEVADLLAKLDKTSPSDVGQLFTLLRDAYARASPEQKKALDVQRAKALNAWIAAFSAAEVMAAEPSKRHDAAVRFTALKTELEALTKSNPASDPEQLSKEKQCLEFASTRVRELSASSP